MIYNGETSSLVASAWEVEQAEKLCAERAGAAGFTIADVEAAVLELRDAEPAEAGL